MTGIAESIRALLSRGIASRGDLQQQLEISQSTFSRAIAQLGQQLVRIGTGRSTRYGLRRELPQLGSSWPVFMLDGDGKPAVYGRLEALARDQYWFNAAKSSLSEVSDGLPYFLQDLWPQGFIGRTAPKRFPELGLPERISDWNDVHALTFLTRRGEDLVGNLVVGDESLQRYLHHLQQQPEHLTENARVQRYPALADLAIAGDPPGSSAGGEHPKFTTVVQGADEVRHVLVKFSPPRVDRVAERWSDLLVAEHLAGDALRAIDVEPCASELVVADNRMFLESRRFDRTGLRGRIGTITLAALADRYIGRRDNWISAAEHLGSMGKISAGDVATIRRAATFGQLIGNTDMHFGNLSFFYTLGRAYSLAPVYDMLPMIDAPLRGDELPQREFMVALPNASTLHIWQAMAAAAENYWRLVAAHSMISTAFRDRAQRNAERIRQSRSAVPG